MSIDSPPSVTVECPPWCDDAPGHAYDSITHGDSLQRNHSRTVAERLDLGEFGVFVTQSETSVSDFGPISRSSPFAWIAAPDAGGMNLTAAQCRDLGKWLSKALNEAAEQLDSITTTNH